MSVMDENSRDVLVSLLADLIREVRREKTDSGYAYSTGRIAGLLATVETLYGATASGEVNHLGTTQACGDSNAVEGAQ